MTTPATTTPRLSNRSRRGVVIAFFVAGCAAALPMAESGCGATFAEGGIGGATFAAPDGACVTAAAGPICWLAWLTAGLLECCGVSWLFIDATGWCLAFGCLFHKVFGDQRP